MSETDEHGRRHPPTSGDECATLRGFLNYQRDTFRWKTDGLDAEQLRRTCAASTMTLGGMMNHLAFVEEYWCSFRLWNQPMGDVFGLVDRNLDPDADWHAATTQSPDALRGRWTASIAQSERNVERALATGGLDQPTRRSSEPDEVPSLRWVLVHLIEEYARHNGHADILRELIDGSVGE